MCRVPAGRKPAASSAAASSLSAAAALAAAKRRPRAKAVADADEEEVMSPAVVPKVPPETACDLLQDLRLQACAALDKVHAARSLCRTKHQ